MKAVWSIRMAQEDARNLAAMVRDSTGRKTWIRERVIRVDGLNVPIWIVMYDMDLPERAVDVQ